MRYEVLWKGFPMVSCNNEVLRHSKLGVPYTNLIMSLSKKVSLCHAVTVCFPGGRIVTRTWSTGLVLLVCTFGYALSITSFTSSPLITSFSFSLADSASSTLRLPVRISMALWYCFSTSSRHSSSIIRAVDSL